VIHGLPEAALHELRERFPRCLIPELISRIAAFEFGREPHVCWASTTYLARQIGRSKRQTFRYFARMKEEGVLHRRIGRREYSELPDKAQRPVLLHLHGYALTGFLGWLAPFVAQARAQLAERRKAKERRKERSRQNRDAKKRAARIEHERELAERFPALAKRAARASADGPTVPHTREVAEAPSAHAIPPPRAPARGPP
jgi:hypothetical protein